jgi:hypothetical protein
MSTGLNSLLCVLCCVVMVCCCVCKNAKRKERSAKTSYLILTRREEVHFLGAVFQ